MWVFRETLQHRNFFPGRLDQDQLWGIIRGYPVFPERGRAVSLKGNQIIFIDAEEQPIEIIDFYPQDTYPRLVSFTGKEICAAFSEFGDQEGIRYARDVRLTDSLSGTVLGAAPEGQDL